MIPDEIVNKMVGEVLPGTQPASRNVFASFQNLADQTKRWLNGNQLQMTKRCFEMVGGLCGKCSVKTQMANENVFVHSVSCCLDALPNDHAAHALLPDSLRALAHTQRRAHGI